MCESIGARHKFYSTKDASRLRFILSARHLGFSVEDIKQILREADNGKTACPLVRTLIARRLAETERQFKAMLLLRQNMMLAVRKWGAMGDKAPSSHVVCHLIEEFEHTVLEENINDRT